MKPCFKALNDPLLLKASLELTPLALEKAFTKREYAFNLIEHDQMIEVSPSLEAYLAKIGLLDKLEFAAIPLCPSFSAGVLHKDMAYPEALNLPIYNCQDSYFAWYDAELVDETVRNTVLDDARKDGTARYMMYRTDTAKEIARVSCMQPIWFNTQVPHRGVNDGMGPRVIATIRFSCKSIWEYFE